MSSFPAANSPQRLGVTSPTVANPNAKVPLRRGFSLMDWVRLNKSGKDLRGIGTSRMIRVTMDELSRHNKREDAWLAIRGFVYNVTAYMDFHPGGVKELMKGVGKDATSLFEEVHRWVNFESMLSACLVGKLEQGPTSKDTSSTGTLLAPVQSVSGYVPLKSTSPGAQTTSTSGPEIVVTEPPNAQASPNSSWYQSLNSVTTVFFTKVRDLPRRGGHVVCDIVDSGTRLLGEIFVRGDCILVDVTFEQPVQGPIEVTTRHEIGNVEIRVHKAKAGAKWREGLKFGEKHCTTVPLKSFELRKRPCKLIDKTRVTHDTTLYHFRLPETSYMRVPIGCHVQFYVDLEGVEISRPYTVSLPDLGDLEAAERQIDPNNFYAMIKTYRDGALTPFVENLQCGDDVLVSNYEGTYDLEMTKSAKRVYAFGAGTGFTPMIRVIGHCLRQADNPRVELTFFNKSEADILWRHQLDSLAAKSSGRFSVVHVLSQPNTAWKGKTGRITLSLIKEILEQEQDGQYVVLLCGPAKFTNLALKFLSELKVDQGRVHAFT